LNRYEIFLISSDNQFGFKRGLSSSHANYTIKSVVNEYCGILSESQNNEASFQLQHYVGTADCFITCSYLCCSHTWALCAAALHGLAVWARCVHDHCRTLLYTCSLRLAWN